MGELRKDYILDRYVIISEIRNKRPDEFITEPVKEKKGTCVFCPGSEQLTPEEIDRFEKNGKWYIRVFPNKFPAVEEKGEANIRTDNQFFTFSASYGKHEVLVETDDHKKQLSDLSVSQIKDIFKMYVKRIQALEKTYGMKYVLVFKNHGDEAGTSLIHSHSQIVAYNKIPTSVENMLKAVKNYNCCPYCTIWNIERNSFRSVFENETFISFTPYASRFAFEIWMFPKRHVISIEDLDDNELKDMADMMKKILLRLKSINASYNFYLINAPKGDNLHFHVEIIPRVTSPWAGFELGSGDVINPVSPESAAKFYRGEE